MALPCLNQYDVRWRDVTMGTSGVTLKKAGCLTTCVSIALAYFQKFRPNCFKTPGELAKLLDYDAAGMLQWKNLAKHIPCELKAKIFWKDNVAFRSALKNPAEVLILELNHGAHFVFALSNIGFGIYRCIDVYGGQVKYFNGSITGGRILKFV